mgnify:FL=1
MTVTLTKPVRIAGAIVAAGTTATYAADVEADLLARNQAVAVGLPVGQSSPGANLAAELAAIGKIASTPAPVYSAAGNLLSATIDGLQYVATEDANGNVATTSYAGVTKTYSWAMQADGNYHCVGIV